jgi:hypothetical protein
MTNSNAIALDEHADDVEAVGLRGFAVTVDPD